MSRFLPFVLALVLVSLAWVLPDVPGARLAALEAGQVLALEEPSEQDEARTFADLVLAGPAVRTVEGDVLELKLHGVFHAAPADPGADILSLHYVARRSIVRALRQRAGDLGKTLEVVGEQAPGPPTKGGAVFRSAFEEDGLALEYSIDGDPAAPVRRSKPWTPASPRSLLPALCAIALAVVLRRPLPALFFGVLAGAFLLLRAEGHGVLAAVPLSVRDYGVELLWPQVVDKFRYQIILFVVFMMAMVGVITRSGGVQGVMQKIAAIAGSARRSQIAAYLMGLAVFFDDYANTLLVGSTMRPLTDRFRVSREKLAYVIDSTAAPVAGLAVLSTWIAFEVSTFSAQLPAAGLTQADGYAVFIATLPYRFYCVFALVFVGLVCFTGRDFGSMLAAERRARREGLLVRRGGRPLVAERAVSMDPAPGARPNAWAGFLPVAAFVLVTLGLIAATGIRAKTSDAPLHSLAGLADVLYAGSGSEPLMYGALVGFVLAFVLALAQGGRAPDLLRAALKVTLGMGIAILILYHAWMIGAVCEKLGTASYLTGLLGDALDPRLLPTALFVLSGFVAFATGSSWSTMSILLPIVVGLAYGLGLDAGLAESAVASGRLLMVMSIGAVLEGAIFGDHCSPISDTTVMSSIAAASDHVDHVRTQMPYAVTTMGVAMLAGYLPCTYFGLSPWLAMPLGAGVLLVLLLWLGRRADAGAGTPAA